MGKYLNDYLKGEPIRIRSKVTALVNSGAETIEEPTRFDQFEGKSIICVVDNGPFQAAAYAYNQSELDCFKRPDGRPKSWLIADTGLVEKFAQ